MKILFPIILLFLTLFFSCKKKVQPDILKVQDPCDCFDEVSADFDIEELATPVEDLWIPTDTTFHTKQVRFSAKEDGAVYKWYIGSEQFTTQKASRYFGNQWAGFDIPITLVVKKEPNNKCFPNDDGYDSITKVFHVSQYPIDYGDNAELDFGPIEGTYRVKNKNGLSDSIDITINARKNGSSRIVDLYNFDGEGTICNQNQNLKIDYVGYRILKFRYSGVIDYCNGTSGKIESRLNNTALLEFKTRYLVNGTVEEKNWYYEGRKLN